MPKRFWLLFSLFFFIRLPLAASGQGYDIQLYLPGYSNSKLLVTYYYFGHLYVKDSLETNAAGRAVFSGEKPLQQGIYQLYFSKEKQLDFLVGEDQSFEIYLDDTIKPPLIKAAWESEKFQEYLNLTDQLRKQHRAISEKKETYKSHRDSVDQFNLQISRITKEIMDFRLAEGLKYPDSFYGKFIAAQQVPKVKEDEIPGPYVKNDSLRWVYEYNYRKKHYWDYFDLGDMRMWHTPYIKERLNDYLNKVLLQTPDTVIPEAIRLIETYKNNKPVFQNLTSFILNNSIQSRVMGIENVFVAIAEKYYLSGQAFWADKSTLDYIRQEVEIRKNNLIGIQAKELLLEDANGEFHSLKQQATPYTVVAFWEPACGHCKSEIPKLYNEVFLKVSPSKLSVYSVYTMTDRTEWLNFIDQHELHDWINVWDPHQNSGFRYLYGVRTTPAIFLLDQDKKIIAKNLDVNSLKQVLASRGLN
ncbi:thioredoxin-like domain-containing protein [Gaoshiqia sp. Z1-71]|uniref:thioredoxin-like domain-containing protein n=1 Tax=Gaoshiqia hydrogeniformans TaxID=3290090 RepID=UPI003BF8316C